MPFNDLRDFIKKLEEKGEVQRMNEEVDWNLEAGAILRKALESDLPAPFFEKVKDYSKNYSLCGGILANQRRIAIAMDMDPNTPLKELMETYLKTSRKPIKPVLVKDAPCKENILIGDKVDLLQFPIPLIHQGDGGRYIGTFQLNISKDPDSGWVNWGMYRDMLHDKNTIGICADPHSHLGGMYKICENRNKPLEVAITIGNEPISSLCAATTIPYGVSEAAVAGGIRGEPIELIKCETIDLEVPATSEIVIEGEMRPSERLAEGPFGEFTGYQTRGKIMRPAIHVKAVTYRNNPIFTMSNEGMPVTDAQAIHSVTVTAEYLEALRLRGLPITGISMPAQAATLLLIVAVKAPYANVAGDIAHVIWAHKRGRASPYIIVVDDDVDPENIMQVLHALVAKCHPYNGIVRLEHGTIISYLPWANANERKNRIGGRVYFDCTWPLHWDPSDIPVKVSFDNIYPPEIQKKALARWEKHGYLKQ